MNSSVQSNVGKLLKLCWQGFSHNLSSRTWIQWFQFFFQKIYPSREDSRQKRSRNVETIGQVIQHQSNLEIKNFQYLFV